MRSCRLTPRSTAALPWKNCSAAGLMETMPSLSSTTRTGAGKAFRIAALSTSAPPDRCGTETATATSHISRNGSEEIAANAHYIGTPYRAYLLSIIKPCGRNPTAALGQQKVRYDLDDTTPKRHQEQEQQFHPRTPA